MTSTEFAHRSADIYMEGFICPECNLDFHRVDDLLAHHATHHKEPRKSGFVDSNSRKLQQLLTLGKTRLKGDFAVNQQTTSHSSNSSGTNPSSTTHQSNKVAYFDNLNYVQPLGIVRNRIHEFKNDRGLQVNRVISDTNKLLSRLEKLLSENAPMEPKLRKEYEQSIVYWIPDADVSLCPQCALRFIPLKRRRHHCRLCGGVMCASCSHFLPFALAQSLLTDRLGLDPSTTMESSSSVQLGFIRRSGSDSSLHSLGLGGQSSNVKPEVRTCTDCRQLLEGHQRRIVESHGNSPVLTLYNSLWNTLSTLHQKMLIYSNLLNSLLRGEDSCDLAHAQDCRHKLRKQLEQVDTLSKRLTELSADSDGVVSDKEVVLYRNIRLYCVNQIRGYTAPLTNLPTPEQYAELKRERRKLLDEQQRQLMKPPHLEDTTKPSSPQFRRQQIGNDGAAFVAQSRSVDSSKKQSKMDPLREQIDNLRQFIEQAKVAGRDEEVEMLEMNLAELLHEFHLEQEQERQQHNQHRTSKSSQPVVAKTVVDSLNPFAEYM